MNFLSATMLRGAEISFPMLGDWSIDPPYSFTVFGFEVYFYGVIIAAGFILAALFCARKAAEFGLTSDDLFDLVIWLIPACIIGARLYYVLFKLDYFIANPSRLFSIRDGGLAIYGGIIAGVIVGILWCRKKKIRLFAVGDLIAFGLFIGQAIGRWGNFINREAFGAETDVFCRMGLTLPGQDTLYVHPTFLYESLWNLVGLIILCVLSRLGKRKYDGQFFWFYILWYGLGRAWVEGLRTDSLYIGSTGIRVSQLLAAVSALAALCVLIVNAKKAHKPEDMFVNRKNRETKEPEGGE